MVNKNIHDHGTFTNRHRSRGLRMMATPKLEGSGGVSVGGGSGGGRETSVFPGGGRRTPPPSTGRTSILVEDEGSEVKTSHPPLQMAKRKPASAERRAPISTSAGQQLTFPHLPSFAWPHRSSKRLIPMTQRKTEKTPYTFQTIPHNRVPLRPWPLTVPSGSVTHSKKRGSFTGIT